jgi:alpha-beta hydrolase superfamily lysophospholipase
MLFLLIIVAGPAVPSLAGETAITVGSLDGVLMVPEGSSQPPVALLIAGSGPIDRNGNGGKLTAATLRKLAAQLAERGIGTLRYDKRGAGGWKPAFGKPEDFRFTHYIDDAVTLIEHLRMQREFSRVYVIGHSEGALVGIHAATRTNLDGLVLLTATSRRIGDLMKEQTSRLVAPETAEPIAKALDRLMAGEIVDPLPVGIRIPSGMQPAFASVFVAEPLVPLAQLKIPVLVAGGGRDLQVRRLDFDQLIAAAPSARGVWLPEMNHVLVDVGDDADNMAAYSQPERSLNSELLEALAGFIRSGR